MTDVYVGWIWFYSCIQCFTSLFCGQDSFFFFFFSLPAPTLAICLPVFSIGFEHERLWSKPIPILEGCSHLLGCSRLPFIHLLQHLCIFPDLHVVFLDQQLGFKAREDYVSLLVSNICGDCIY